jgi:hypothetical protein
LQQLAARSRFIEMHRRAAVLAIGIRQRVSRP